MSLVNAGAAGSAEEDLARLKAEMEDFRAKAESEIAELKAQLTEAKAETKAEAELTAKALRNSESAVVEVKEELEQVKQDLNASQKEVSRLESLVQQGGASRAEASSLRDKVAALQYKVEELEGQATEGAEAYVKAKRDLEKAKAVALEATSSRGELETALSMEVRLSAAGGMCTRLLACFWRHMQPSSVGLAASRCVSSWYRNMAAQSFAGPSDRLKNTVARDLLLKSVLQRAIQEPQSQLLQHIVGNWRSLSHIGVLPAQEAVKDAMKPLHAEIVALKEEIGHTQSTLTTYEVSRQIVWEYRKHSNPDPRLVAWTQLPPMLSQACEKALTDGVEVVKGSHMEGGKDVALVLMILQRKAIRLDSGKQTELRRRNPTMKFETLGCGMKAPRVNYLGFQMTKDSSMDSQAVLTALAMSMAPEKRPPRLKKALDDLFLRDLKIEVPAYDPSCQLNEG